ncbi:MAG: heterodisulfide reductase-related iron-sulfur binding cluster, partial [Chromatiales bacterium]
LERFAEFLERLGEQVRQPVLMEGVAIARGRDGAPEVVVLGFVPADERRFAFNIAFGITLAVTGVAEAVGGRAYSTGLYFTSKAEQVFGAARRRRLEEFRQSVDPRHRFNPGKVIDPRLIARLIGLAGPFTPLVRALTNRLETRIGERFDHERNPTGTGTRLGEDRVRGIPADVAWYAYACSQCGYCVNECDQFYGRGWESQSPRGKWFWLREYMEGRADWSRKMVDSFLVCTTCELCNHRCSSALPIEPSWMKLRGLMINEQDKGTIPPFEMMAASLDAHGDIWAGYRKDRDSWFPADLRDRHGPGKPAKAVYFAGCTASYVEHDIGIASVRLLDEAGVDFAYLGEVEQCCGTPMLCSGKWDLFERIMRENIEAVKAAGADTVISSCPACDLMWRTYYPKWAERLGIDYGIRARHYTEVVAERIESGEFTFPERSDGKSTRVTWHDSCHMGRASGVYEPPRSLIRALPGVELVEMAHNREEAHCCGSVLSLIGEPPVAADLGKIRLDEAVEAGAEKVLACCPCCEFQFRVAAEKKDVKLEIQDLAHLAAAQLGYELPDPHPEVRRQWAVFEGMIALMTPQGFADLMEDMFPEMIDAMPWGMGRMMRAMARIPGGLEAMRPLFPVLFPRLLPVMMPALMPGLLRRVQERIPMPDYMAEQMPDLMPRVMDNLMPHMIGDVVPLVSQPLIDHLHARAGRAA